MAYRNERQGKVEPLFPCEAGQLLPYAVAWVPSCEEHGSGRRTEPVDVMVRQQTPFIRNQAVHERGQSFRLRSCGEPASRLRRVVSQPNRILRETNVTPCVLHGSQSETQTCLGHVPNAVVKPTSLNPKSSARMNTRCGGGSGAAPAAAAVVGLTRPASMSSAHVGSIRPMACLFV